MNARMLMYILKRRGYEIYQRPWELNIVGIRSDSSIPNLFDDSIHVFYKTDKQHWQYHRYPATTDPGTYWLSNPMNPQGTAILAQGQYKGAYQLGLHQGKYTALVQRGPVKIIRDYDRNAVLDFLNGEEATGYFGINIHRASLAGTTKYVDRYSAGCQVLANIRDFEQLLDLSERHRSLYGNRFTYTLIDQRALAREQLRLAAYGVTVAVLSLTGLLLTWKAEETGAT